MSRCSWKEAEFALSHPCVCVCVFLIHFVTTGLICVTAGGQSSGCGWGTVPSLSESARPLCKYAPRSGPTRSVLAPPGRSAPDGLDSGGRFGTYSGRKIWAAVL